MEHHELANKGNMYISFMSVFIQLNKEYPENELVITDFQSAVLNV